MATMPSLLDIAERSQKGPRVEEKSWDMDLFRKMAQLTRKYGIVMPEAPPWFNMDDTLQERAFRAAVEFLSEVGVYCPTTGRVLQFTEEEVLAAVRDQPSRILVGEGRDRRVLEKLPLEFDGDFGLFPGMYAPFSEDLASLVVKNFAQIPEASYIGGFNFRSVDGREIFGMPMEAYAARRQVAWMRDGIRKAGRPGLAIVYYPVNTRAAVLTAPLDPDNGLRRIDGVMLSVLNDVKIEQDLLTAAIVYQEYGGFKVNNCVGRFGSFVGGHEAAIVESVISAIVGWLCYRCETGKGGISLFVEPKQRSTAYDRKAYWASSVAAQAVNQHTNYIYFSGHYELRSSGPGTETGLWLAAREAIQARTNGANLVGYRALRPQMNAGQTPLETEFKAEVVRAAIRSNLDRQGANEMMDKIAGLTEGMEPEAGKPITECYDLVNHRPSPEYLEIYLRVKDRLAGMGLSFE